MIAALFILLGVAFAEPPTCDSLAAPDRDRVSVAWVSPLGQRVGGGARVTVVPAAALRRWAAAEKADVTRLLQGLGLRRSIRPPTRPWKVTVMEVDVADLCRPLPLPDDGNAAPVAGIAACERGDRGLSAREDGCGYSTDLATGRRGLDLYTIRWDAAVRRGFCVLPVDRFLEGP